MNNPRDYRPHPDDNINALVKAALENMQALERAFANGVVPDQSLPIEAGRPLYRVVEHLCRDGYFLNAAPLIFQLAVFHPNERPYVHKAAQIFQRLAIFEMALLFYAMVINKEASPAAAYGMAQCLVGLNRKEDAIRYFETAFELARGEHRWRTLQDHAAAAIERFSGAY